MQGFSRSLQKRYKRKCRKRNQVGSGNLSNKTKPIVTSLKLKKRSHKHKKTKKD